MSTIEMISDPGTRGIATSEVETVEIKVTVRPDQELRALRALELKDDAAQPRVIYFYDTAYLDLLNYGLVLRARRVEGDADDSTVKIRPVDPARIPRHWRQKKGFKVEIDRTGARSVCSGSLTERQRSKEIVDVAQGVRAIEKLFSKDQESFLKELGGRLIDFSKLRVLGPIRVLRWGTELPPFHQPVTVEEWRLPNGHDLVEISIKCDAGQGHEARRTFDSRLRALGLDPTGAQETKTRTALEFLARLLRFQGGQVGERKQRLID